MLKSKLRHAIEEESAEIALIWPVKTSYIIKRFPTGYRENHSIDMIYMDYMQSQAIVKRIVDAFPNS